MSNIANKMSFKRTKNKITFNIEQLFEHPSVGDTTEEYLLITSRQLSRWDIRFISAVNFDDNI